MVFFGGRFGKKDSRETDKTIVALSPFVRVFALVFILKLLIVQIEEIEDMPLIGLCSENLPPNQNKIQGH